MRPHRGAWQIGILLGSAVCGGAALAQSTPPESAALLQQQRELDRQLEQQRRAAAPLDALLDWQWGGWVDYYVFSFNDGIQSQRVLQRPSMSLWTRLRLDDGAHEVFARMRLSYSYYNPGDEYDRQEDWVGPELDRGWYQIDIGKAFRLNQPSDPVQAQVRVGRQEVRIGTGYMFDMPLDAVQVFGTLGDFRVTGLIGKTISNYPNIDRSEAVDSHTDRDMFAVQLSYEGFEHHVPFAYALWNNDKTDERPKDLFQDYSYDSQYFGLGSRGAIVKNLNYWGEFVFEQGHSFSSGNFIHKNPIDSFGWDLGLEYLFQGPLRPRISGEYMFASGDSDRVYSPTDATGGIQRDGVDTSFVGFGYRDTGIAAGPTLSNLHVFRAGGSLTPFEKVDLLRDFEIGTNWFLYHKNAARGAISDPTAGDYDGYVGWEMDYFVNWRLASDLSWTFRWGSFFPGDAFDDRSNRNFFFTGITWSF